MRPEAEVDESPLPVAGDDVAALLLDELDLERLAHSLEQADGLVLGQGQLLDGHVRGDELRIFSSMAARSSGVNGLSRRKS